MTEPIFSSDPYDIEEQLFYFYEERDGEEEDIEVWDED